MTLREFRKLLLGCNADADLVFYFENAESSDGVQGYKGVTPVSVHERQYVDEKGGQHPYIVIVLRGEACDAQ